MLSRCLSGPLASRDELSSGRLNISGIGWQPFLHLPSFILSLPSSLIAEVGRPGINQQSPKRDTTYAQPSLRTGIREHVNGWKSQMDAQIYLSSLRYLSRESVLQFLRQLGGTASVEGEKKISQIVAAVMTNGAGQNPNHGPSTTGCASLLLHNCISFRYPGRFGIRWEGWRVSTFPCGCFFLVVQSSPFRPQ